MLRRRSLLEYRCQNIRLAMAMAVQWHMPTQYIGCLHRTNLFMYFCTLSAATIYHSHSQTTHIDIPLANQQRNISFGTENFENSIHLFHHLLTQLFAHVQQKRNRSDMRDMLHAHTNAPVNIYIFDQFYIMIIIRTVAVPRNHFADGFLWVKTEDIVLFVQFLFS